MRQFNDDALERLGAATAHARALLPEDLPFGADAPDLLVLLRDARLRLQHAGRTVSADAMLASALEPAGDALDATRSAVRAFFSNRTMIQMKQPDEDDLVRMGEPGGMPSAARPFWTSFLASAETTTAALRPKAVGGVPLSGELLAAVARGLVEQINANAVVSLHRELGAVLHEQAEDAVAAARAAFRAAANLPSARGERGPRAPLALTPAALDMMLHNATRAAINEFRDRAPALGGGGAAGWLMPYIEQLRISLDAAHVQARQAHAHSLRLAAVAASERRLRSEREETRTEMARLRASHTTLRRDRAQELLSNVLVLMLAATSAFVPLTSPLVHKLAPAASAVPTMLAGLGMWRVAQRPLRRWAGTALAGVRGTVGQMFVTGWPAHPEHV